MAGRDQVLKLESLGLGQWVERGDIMGGMPQLVLCPNKPAPPLPTPPLFKHVAVLASMGHHLQLDVGPRALTSSAAVPSPGHQRNSCPPERRVGGGQESVNILEMGPSVLGGA